MFEGFLGADELAAAQDALWLHYPRPEEYFADPAAHAWLATEPVGRHHQRTVAILEPEPSGLHPDLLDLAERFWARPTCVFTRPSCGPSTPGPSTTTRATTADFGNHTLVVPKRSDPATQIISLILLSDVGEEDRPTKVVPLSVGENVPYWRPSG